MTVRVLVALSAAPVVMLTVLSAVGVVLVGAAAGGPAPAAGGGMQRPVTNAVITQPFGCTAYAFEAVNPGCAGGHFHSGMDLAAPAGTPVRTMLGGTAHVVLSAGGYGLHIIVDHGDGLSSLYGHLSVVGVADDQRVVAGQVIGAVGSTGNSTGPHLHFEIRRDGIPENPALDLDLP